MNVNLRSGHRQIELRQCHTCCASDTFLDFGSLELALSFLQKYKSDAYNMTSLRRFTAIHYSQKNLSRMNDHQVLHFLARGIVDRNIRVVVYKAASPLKAGAPAESAQATLPKSTPVERPAPLERVKPVSPQPPIEEAVFAATVDAAAQAAALKSAAQAGVPFCEECEKARLARQKSA